MISKELKKYKGIIVENLKYLDDKNEIDFIIDNINNIKLDSELIELLNSIHEYLYYTKNVNIGDYHSWKRKHL